jgi:hypothetical protein
VVCASAFAEPFKLSASTVVWLCPAIIYNLGIAWITPDPSFLLKLSVLSLVIPLLLVCLGELNAAERRYIGEWLTQQPWLKVLSR